MRISLATSAINPAVRKNVKECLDTGIIGWGHFNKDFEKLNAEFLGVPHAVCCCNGTVADWAALVALHQLEPSKTEVVMPALTFTAQAEAVVYANLKPVFVDVRSDYQIDLEKVEAAITPDTLAIFAVHLLGRVCDIKALREIADRHDIFLVEDCCEAYGAELDGQMAGTFGHYGTYSFFPSHTVTTGEGGLIVSPSESLADLVRKVLNHGRRGEDVLNKFHFDIVGFNGKMNHVSAAIGCGVIPKAAKVIAKRRKNVELFNSLLGRNWYASSPHCYPVDFLTTEARDQALLRLAGAGIEARKLFSSLPTQEKCYAYLGYKPGDFPVAEDIGSRQLFVPVHQDLKDEDIEEICKVLCA